MTCYHSQYDRSSRIQRARFHQADDAVGRGMRFLLPLDTALGKSHGGYGRVSSVSRGVAGFSPGDRGAVQKSGTAGSSRRSGLFRRPCRAEIARDGRSGHAAFVMVRTFTNLPLVGGYGLSFRGRQSLLAAQVLVLCSSSAMVKPPMLRFTDAGRGMRCTGRTGSGVIRMKAVNENTRIQPTSSCATKGKELIISNWLEGSEIGLIVYTLYLLNNYASLSGFNGCYSMKPPAEATIGRRYHVQYSGR